MDIKNILLLIAIPNLFQSCDECKPDKYGEVLELDVPISTNPAKDTFFVGDTLTIESNFSKEVQLYNKSETIRLDSFKFFALFGLSEISDTIEDYDIQIDTIVQAGKLGYLPLQGAVAYPVEFDENPNGYHFAFKIVIHERGKYWLNISSSPLLYEEPYYEHPALYLCDNNRRDAINIYFTNISTTLQAYNQIFRTTKVDYLLRLMDFDRYSKAGSISIIVK